MGVFNTGKVKSKNAAERLQKYEMKTSYNRASEGDCHDETPFSGGAMGELEYL